MESGYSAEGERSAPPAWLTIRAVDRAVDRVHGVVYNF